MEFTRLGDQLQTLIKWHTMDERPDESGYYLVIWHTSTGKYLVQESIYSKKYNLFGCSEAIHKDAYEAVEASAQGIAGEHEKNLCGWYKVDFTECFKDDGGEF